MNKIMVFLIICTIIPIVSAEDYGNHVWTANNILRPGWDNFLSVMTLGIGSDKDEDVVPGMFGYTLKGWELSVCSQHVTNDLSYQPPDGFSGISTDLSKIYDTTATLSATKTKYRENQTLIEVFWYIQPKVGDVEYNVYLLKGSQKFYLAKSKSDSAQGETGYTAEYYIVDFTHAVLEYKSGQEILRAEISERLFER